MAVRINLAVKDESPLRCVYLLLTAPKLTYSCRLTSGTAAAVKSVWRERFLFYKATTRNLARSASSLISSVALATFVPPGITSFHLLVDQIYEPFPLLSNHSVQSPECPGVPPADSSPSAAVPASPRAPLWLSTIQRNSVHFVSA